MAELAAEIGDIDARLAAPDAWSTAGRDGSQALTERRAALAAELEAVEQQWLEVSETLENLQAGAT
jgi:hypothetical protein